MQYKILASDYDNTLVPFGEGKPRQKVVKAIKKLQAAGGRFVLSTGRAYPCVNLKGQLGGIRFDYAITCNGACVVDKNGAIVAEHPMTNEEMYALVDFCEDYNYPLQFDFRAASWPSTRSPLRKCTHWWISARIITIRCSSISGMPATPTASMNICTGAISR